MEKCVHLDHIALGACYYPEQWPRTMWQSDLRRMKAHGIETVRVFEFAWSVIEPKDDTWDFSLFDEFLSLAAEEKMQVISGFRCFDYTAGFTYFQAGFTLIVQLASAIIKLTIRKRSVTFP